MRLQCVAMLVSVSCGAIAEGIAFDRPGIAFSPSTLAPGAVSWEQGLPDGSRDRENGVEITSYAANALLRVGLSAQWELQLGGSPFNRVELRAPGLARQRSSGAGDTSVALKYVLARLDSSLQWGFLGKISSPTGNADFSSGRTQLALGTTANWQLSDRHAFGLYFNVSRDADERIYTVSPNFSLQLSPDVGAYIEAGISKSSDAPTESIAGLGLTVLATESIQLDLSADWGLNDASTDVIAGFGVSLYID